MTEGIAKLKSLPPDIQKIVKAARNLQRHNELASAELISAAERAVTEAVIDARLEWFRK